MTPQPTLIPKEVQAQANFKPRKSLLHGSFPPRLLALFSWGQLDFLGAKKTLPQTNVAPKNGGFQLESPFHFQGICLFQGGYPQSEPSEEFQHLAWHLTPAAARCSRYCHQNDLNEESLFVETSSPPSEFGQLKNKNKKVWRIWGTRKIGEKTLVPSWELTYPFTKALLKMFFLS